jgi:hypothetical protein
VRLRNGKALPRSVTRSSEKDGWRVVQWLVRKVPRLTRPSNRVRENLHARSPKRFADCGRVDSETLADRGQQAPVAVEVGRYATSLSLSCGPVGRRGTPLRSRCASTVMRWILKRATRWGTELPSAYATISRSMSARPSWI